MKPVYILNSLLTVLLVLLIISFVFPPDGISINDKTTLKFPTFTSLFSEPEANYADISDIINNTKEQINDTLVSVTIEENILPQQDTFRVTADSLKRVTLKIEYPNNNRDILIPFFKSLQNVSTHKNLIRIIHYGDSQIEGDRISSYLRNKFQKQFGGSGIGLINAFNDHCESASIRHTNSNNWKQHSIFYKRDTILPHRRFGVLTSFSRFAPYQNDSIITEQKQHEAWISIEKSNISFKSVRNFNVLRIFYGYNNKPIQTEFYIDDTLKFFEIFPENQSLNSYSWNFNQSVNNIKIVFKGQDSPDIYAIALDNKYGVALDNISLRGSSGTDFTRTNQSLLRDMYKLLNVKLIVLQFGVNVVPHEVRSYKYYERSFYRQLLAFKKMNPNIPIIVIGVSDMSRKKGTYYESYPNIEKIRNAQKQAAFKANCAFWDMYKAMGGYNSMPSWVFAQPPLAQKDFTHFSYRGSRIIAQMFYNAIMNDYNAYVQNNKE